MNTSLASLFLLLTVPAALLACSGPSTDATCEGATCAPEPARPLEDGGSADAEPARDGSDERSDGSAPRRLLKRQGTHLVLDGKPFRAVGVNAYGMSGCETGTPFSDAEMDAFFGSLPPATLTRAWAFESQGMVGIERMVKWAEKHGQLLVLSLTNALGDCGDKEGIPAGSNRREPAWYAGGYKTKYIPWVKQVVERFKGSDAVGMWELINEPGGGAVTDLTMRLFFDDAAATIKSIDPDHLVESGAQAGYITGTQDYAYVHAGPNVDVGSLHEYDYDFDNSKTIVSSHLAPALAAMHSIDKPLLVGEVGIKASDGARCTTRAARRVAFEAKFDAYLAKGVVGVLAWNWSPTKRDTCDYETIYPGDPTMDLIRTYAR